MDKLGMMSCVSGRALMGLRCRLQAPSHAAHATQSSVEYTRPHSKDTTLSRHPPAVDMSISGSRAKTPPSYSILPYYYTWVHTPAYYPSTPRARSRAAPWWVRSESAS